MRSLLVIGHGMVGHRLVAALAERGGLDAWNVTVLGEEPQPAYDRVALSSLFNGAVAADLDLRPHEAAVTVLSGQTVARIDPAERTFTTARGKILSYDALVLATGSAPFVPPLHGHDAVGCF